MHLLECAGLLLESKLEYIILKYEKLFIDDFLAYLAEIMESPVMKTDLNVTVKVGQRNVARTWHKFVHS